MARVNRQKIAIAIAIIGILFSLVGIVLVEVAAIKGTSFAIIDEFALAWVLAPLTLLAIACASDSTGGIRAALAAAALFAVNLFYFFFVFIGDLRWWKKNRSETVRSTPSPLSHTTNTPHPRMISFSVVMFSSSPVRLSASWLLSFLFLITVDSRCHRNFLVCVREKT